MQYHAIPCITMQFHATPCNTIQYHAIPYKTMQYHAKPCHTMQVQDGPRWCKMVQDSAIPCKTMQYHAIPCKTMQYHKKPCHTMQYHAISCNTMQYHAIPCIINNCWWSVPLPCGQYRAIFWLATELCSNLTPISCTIINMWRLAIVIWNVFYHTNAADLKLRIWYEDICHQVSLLSELGQDKKTRTSSKSNILFYLLCTSEIITCLIVSGCKNNLVN